jgi:hypothetical protein
MNYAYNNNYANPYSRPFVMPNYAQPQYQMPAQQPQIQPQPQQPIQFEMPVQYVGSATLKEAEAYILFPNQKALFIDKQNGMVYEKVCGNDGQSFISAYKKIEPENEKQGAELVKEEKPLELGEFAKKTDLKDFVTIEQYKELKEMFDGLKGQLNDTKQTTKTKTDKGEE